MNALENESHIRTRATATGSLVIIAAAALAVAPELLWGNSCGHDFDFHLVSWFDALNSWRHGIPYPHWTPSANFGAGEPRFVFYSPLTWMLGAALAAFIPWSLVPGVLTFVLLAGTGLATRALAREVLSEGGASLAGCIAIFSGYPLFTAYERSAFAELAGGIWIPLVLLYGLRNGKVGIHETETTRRVFNGSIVPLAIAIAGSWLSNPTVGVMACYSLAALVIAVAPLTRSLWPAVRSAAGTALGLGLSAIYLIPAAWEQRWVDIHQVTEDPGQTLENNWLFARHADPGLIFHDQVLHTASIIVVVMIVITVCALVACKLCGRLPGQRAWWLPLSLIPVAVFLLQFAISGPLWNLLPDLRFLQFPWRWLLVLEAPMAIFLAAVVWPQADAKRARSIAVVFFAAVFVCLTASASKLLYQSCYAEDTVPAMLSVLHTGQGYIGTNEYEPVGADISLIPKNLPEACLVSDPDLVLGKENADGEVVWDAKQDTCEATYAFTQNSGPEHVRIIGAAPRSGYLIVRLLTYPAWQFKLNGQPIEPGLARKDGLTVVPIMQRPFALSLDWTPTRDVSIARAFSGLSVFVLTAISWFERRLKKVHLS